MKGGKYTIRGVANQVAEDKLEHGTHKHASYIPWLRKVSDGYTKTRFVA